MSRTWVILLLALFATLAFVRIGHCVPAAPLTHQIEQPDGRTISARQLGDERGHGWETMDGYTIIKDPATQYWHYASQDRTTHHVRAGNIVGAQSATQGLEKHLRLPKAAYQGRYAGTAARAQATSMERTTVSGARPLPVMMVNFSDTDTSFDANDFQELLFGTGNKSMKDYYEEVSYGAFTVGPGPAGVMGWYSAAQSHAYYGDNDMFGYDAHPATLVHEAVCAADATVDFSEYDTDGDCYVDAVVIIHQGAGEEASGTRADIWSHQWDLNSAKYYGDGTGIYYTNDTAACGRIKINDYVIQPEVLYGDIQTIGVFAHEYGHVIGLPDLYDVDYSSSGIGYWGLMSGGSWGMVHRPGDSPVHLCAWSKYALGWIHPVVVSSSLLDEPIDPAAAYDDVYLLFPDNQINDQEYYLIENRQRIGFDAGLRGTGLAIWHIDESMAGNDNADNSTECDPLTDCTDSHYRVALVQADGDWDLERGSNWGDSGDLFPGASANTLFDSASDPNSALYDGSASHVSVADILPSGSTITATLSLSYDITAAVAEGGSITPGNRTTLNRGDHITFAITPHTGYHVSNVVVDGESIGAVSEYTFADIDLDHAISAVFTTDSETTAPANGSDSGGGGGGGCFISVTTLE